MAWSFWCGFKDYIVLNYFINIYFKYLFVCSTGGHRKLFKMVWFGILATSIIISNMFFNIYSRTSVAQTPLET